MKDITISTGDSASMTAKFQTYKKRTSVYAASKGYKHWPSVITNMKPVDDADWKVKRPNKNLYATKRITKIDNEDKSFIMKQEWVVTDCEKQDELEDNHTNMQQQKTAEHALYRKNGAAMFIVMYGQLHPEIITIAKRSTSPDFTTVVQEQDVVGLLSILQSICVKNLTSSRVDPYSEHLKIQASTLSYVQTKDVSNDDFGDAILDQVTATQSQCGNFVFGEQYHLKVLSDNGLSSLSDYFNLGTDAERETYDDTTAHLCPAHYQQQSVQQNTRVPLGTIRCESLKLSRHCGRSCCYDYVVW